MTEQHAQWDEASARGHARWVKLGARVLYPPFARRIAAYLAPLEREVTVVDLGTGPGLLSIELDKLLPQAKLIGVDPSAEMLKIARENAEEAGVANYEARPGSAEKLPISSNAVDAVVTQSSFHEWADPQKGLVEVFRVLKPGGSLFLKDYNRAWFSGWKRGLFRLLITMIGESYEDHLEMFRFTLEEVVDLLREAGFDEIVGDGRGLSMFVRAVKQPQ